MRNKVVCSAVEVKISGLIETSAEMSEQLQAEIPRRHFNVDEYYQLAEIGVLRLDDVADCRNTPLQNRER